MVLWFCDSLPKQKLHTAFLCYYLWRCHPQCAVAACARVCVGVQSVWNSSSQWPQILSTPLAGTQLVWDCSEVASKTLKGHKGWDVSVLKLQLTAHFHGESMPEVWRPLSWGECCSPPLQCWHQEPFSLFSSSNNIVPFHWKLCWSIGDFFWLFKQNLSDLHNFNGSKILVINGHHDLRWCLDWEDHWGRITASKGPLSLMS